MSLIRFYKKQNVFDETLDRIRYIFDEFPNVIVGFSGGKDSTVTLNLALQVAKEKNRLPLKVMFLDQEAEWQAVIDYVKTIMYSDEVEPLWLQVPIKLFNATSHTEKWLMCWDEEEKDDWIHPKDDVAIKVNKYGTDRFNEMFTKFVGVEYPNTKTCYLSGVRAEESPTRAVALTRGVTYKHITYGKKLNSSLGHYTFYPLYDWSYTDIWKAINENKWEYCKIYDYMYQYGISVPNMRVSNVHHETAVHSLFYLQEIESDTWNRIVKRIDGINTAGALSKEQFFIPKELPYMFEDWKEYRDYLLENLIIDKEVRDEFSRQFERLDGLYVHNEIKKRMWMTCSNALMLNDYHKTKIGNFERAPEVYTYKQWLLGKVTIKDIRKHNRYIEDALKNPIDEFVNN